MEHTVALTTAGALIGYAVVVSPRRVAIRNRVCNHTADQLAWMDLATPLDGPYIAHFKALARELDMAIAAAYL